MRNPVTKVGALALTILVTSYLAPAWATPPDSGEFAEALASAYKNLAEVERIQGDHRSGDSYAARAAAAERGEPTAPDSVQIHQGFLPQHYIGELVDARSRLVNALDQGGRGKAPRAAARAQSTFDCWIEQASEDLQDAHIEECKEAYLVAVSDVEKALIPPRLPPPPVTDPDTDEDGVADSRDDCPRTPSGTPVDEHGCPKIPNLAGVHFEHDESVLTGAAHSILNEAKLVIEDNPHVRINIVGHTDSSGSDDYNQTLSEHRAAAVLQYIVSMGISSSRLSASGRGETSPIADNSNRDGRQTNRRVELTARPIE
ncbi:MAG: outer membrane protein OmpA-like peptidoglycan-associated protein [Gammaproteobacteria bacterium]|jgi:outer membrane protein OmpA-like peptidoglycan-associated protein